MWILPKNLNESYQCAPEFRESKEDLQELALQYSQSCTWKSKHGSVQIWLRAWKRVYWLPHLFSRTLPSSMHLRFVEKYTASLADIHVPENLQQDFARGTFIKDSFGQILDAQSQTVDLFGAFSRTWTTTLRERIRSYSAAYEIWVTQLRQESTRRMKLARHMRERDSLYWLSQMNWGTPRVSTNGMNGSDKKDSKSRIEDQVHKNWHTPIAQDSRSSGTTESRMNRMTQELATQVQQNNWATPRASEFKGSGPKGSKSQVYRLEKMYLDAQVEEIDGQQDKASSNTDGKPREQLNPAWVLQLMGTTLEKTFFVPLATAWSNSVQK